MKVIILVTLLLFVVYCAAQVSQTDQNTILSLHNNARASASPTPQTPLKAIVWDSAIATVAQTWVSQCKQAYSSNYYSTLYGENPVILNRLDVTSAFNYWFAQKSSYNFADATCSGSCANFQQIVSDKTTAIGCGVATCSFGVFFVCNYKTFSQYTGVLPYTPVAGTTPIPPVPTPAPTSAPATSGTSSGYASIDYRGTNRVLGVHDQGQCGSCWAFSTTTIIEGVLGPKGVTQLLSDQNVLDCSGSGSCNGGWTGTALKGMITKGGINTQAAYPYKAAQGTCAYNAAISQGKITTYGQTKGDFASIYNALKTYGPVGIALDATNAWHSYSSGVLSYDSTTINHAVTIVGYDAAKNAWIVKNSWGKTWGISGYLYLDAAHPGGANINGAFWAQ